jgi:hypothetical protein
VGVAKAGTAKHYKMSQTTKTTEELYDVLIVHCETRIVDTVAGNDMPMSEGSFHTAEKRHETVAPRLNDHYFCGIYPAGLYKKGDQVTTDSL